MNKIDARSKSVRELMDGVKYGIDYYQREYKWTTKQITELLEDLESKFFDSFREEHSRSQVGYYTHYFLGSVVISSRNGQKYIIDGQQRLTSLTLLLIYLYNLQRGRAENEQVDVDKLIYSEKYGTKSFNLDIEERIECIETLYNNQPFDPAVSEQPESVRSVAARYNDIVENFPVTLKNGNLPYFIDWLIDNVDLVEIMAYSDDEAYTIFETMNDRGLNLSPTDMLKGYLLANITDPTDRDKANDLWKKRLLELIALQGKEEEDFFKAWLRAKYADSIREGRKGAVNKDFEKIGTFHKWVREEKDRIGLKSSDDFRDFVMNRFNRFAGHYGRIRQAALKFTPGLEYIFYNAHNNFTLQYPLLLAPLCIEDDMETADRKMRLVAGYLDIFIARRVVNFRTLNYSSIVYTMFNLMKEIRDLDLLTLAATLERKVVELPETFSGINSFYLHMQNRHAVHYILARITRHIEEQCGINSDFYTYVARDIKKPFEIEHIWANQYDRHTDEFTTERDFSEYRNRVGDLVLLPRGFNQSFGDKPYDEKLGPYYGQNLLAKSLNEQCYRNDPSFMAYINRSGLPFRAYPTFKKSDLDARQELYRLICEEIWSPSRFDRELD